MSGLQFDDPFFSIEYVSKFNPSSKTIYFFVGAVEDESVRTILTKFETKSKSISREEQKKIKQLFPQLFDKIIESLRTSTLKFIYSRILMDDSLNELKKKIFIHCSSAEKSIYYLPANLELWVVDKEDHPHILGYKYKGMKPHLFEEIELKSEYEYTLQQEEPSSTSASTSSSPPLKKKTIDSGDNYTLIYDLIKKIDLKNNQYHFYFSDALQEFNLIDKSRYDISDLKNKYFKKYFPVASLDIKLPEIRSTYLLTKEDNKLDEFLKEQLFHYPIDPSHFEPYYFYNFMLNVNTHGIIGKSSDQSPSLDEIAIMEGGAKKGMKIVKKKIVNSRNLVTNRNVIVNKSVNKSKSKSVSVNKSNSKSVSVNRSEKKPEESEQENIFEFIDLYQIFEYLRTKKIGKKTPYIKYNDLDFSNPFTLISKSAIDSKIVTKDLLYDKWANPQIPLKKFNGLQVKRYIKDIRPTNSPLFTTINLYKYGRVQLSMAFKTENKATFGDIQDCIENCRNYIQDINQNVIDYRIRRSIGENVKIIPPQSNLNEAVGLQLSDNCSIAYMNYYIEYHPTSEIDLKELLEFAKLFPTFLTLPEVRKETQNSIEIRYNRVSGFLNLDKIMSRIDDLKKFRYNDGIILAMLEKEFGKSTQECKRYLLEYKRKYSHIRSSSSDSDRKGFTILITKNSITVRGVKNSRHIYDTYRFLTLFLSFFMNRDKLKRDPQFRNLLFSTTNRGRGNQNTNLLFQIDENFLESLDLNDLSLDREGEAQMIEGLGLGMDLGLGSNLLSENVKAEGGEIEETGQFRLRVGNRVLAGNDEIGTDVQLTCDGQPAIPELDTCQDACDDAKYFLRRLQRHDPHLFGTQSKEKKGKKGKKNDSKSRYSESCQKTRQPVILGYDPDQGISLESNNPIKRNSYTFAVKYSTNPEISNWYICPNVWCPICQIPIPKEDLDPSLILEYKTAGSGGVCTIGICPFGDHKVFIRDETRPYPGFLKKSSEEGFCLPCCFGNPQNDKKYEGFKMFQKCLGVEGNNSNEEEDVIYVLGKSIPLDRNRYGTLNPRMEMVLNSNIKADYLDRQRGFLRRGIRHEPNNSFLSAIANIFSCDQENPRSVDDLKEYIVSKIDENLFRSLYGGNLWTIFYDPHKNITPLQNYKNYILSKNINIDHTYLWDLVQRPGIIAKNGVNLFIFENNLLCPVGENVREFYDKEKRTIILSKHRQYYEPIYYVEGDGKQAAVRCHFDNDTMEIAKLFEIAYDGCASKFRIDWKAVVSNTIGMNKEDVVIDYGLTLNETIIEIMTAIQKGTLTKDFRPVLQYVDTSNKVFGIELKNKLYLPVKPSKIIVDVPTLSYRIIDDYIEISKLPLLTTIEQMRKVEKNSRISYPIEGFVSDIAEKNVVGIMLKNQRFILVEKIAIEEMRKRKELKKIPVIGEKFYTDIDKYIQENIQLVDERVLYMNKRKFEDETYLRMRFELSRYLQDHPGLKENIREIVEKKDRSIDKKRGDLENILLPVFERLLTFETNGRSKDYHFYEKPNQRIPCSLRKVMKRSQKNSSSSSSSSKSSSSKDIIFSCDEDPHCSAEANQCKLYLNEYNLVDPKKKNLNFYMPMIIEELVRFTLKRNEILNDNIPNIIQRERVDENPLKYYIIHTTDPEGIIQKIENIFLDTEGLFLDRRPLYDTTTTHHYVLPEDKYTLLNRSRLIGNMNQIPEMWSKVLGFNFLLLIHPSGHRGLYRMIDLLIREWNQRNNSNQENNQTEELNVRKLKERAIAFMTNSVNRLLIERIKDKLKPLYFVNKNVNQPMAQPRSGSGSGSGSNSNNEDQNQSQKEYLLQIYKLMNPKLFGNVFDFNGLRNKILNDDYEGNDFDIAILSHLLHINFIILNKVKKGDGEKAVMYGNEATDYYTDNLLLLRNNNIGPFSYQWFQVKNKGLIHKKQEYQDIFQKTVLNKF